MLLVREKVETSEKYGYYPHERPVEQLLKYGAVIIDKPRGPTSHQVVAWVKEILGIAKAGQTGTLDPNATGVLVILLNHSVKITQILARSDKEYIALMKLHADVEPERVMDAVKRFEGTITQIPPVRSAVARKPRKRKIHHIKVLEMEGRYVLLRVKCEAGTYIRRLCVDIGKTLGVNANLQELRRIAVGHISEDKSHYLQDLVDAYVLWKEKGDDSLLREVVLPMEYLLKDVKKVLIKDSAISPICYGAQLHVGGISMVDPTIRKGDTVAIMSLKGELVAVGKAEMSAEGMANRKKGVACTIKRVIMEKDTYPKLWKTQKSE